MIESANWEIPGYATGVYHVLVHNGKVFFQLYAENSCESPVKVMWEQAKITEDSVEPSGDCSAEKNIKAMNAYSKALQLGDMKSCLPVLVSLFHFSKLYSTPPTQDPSYTFSGVSEIPVPRADIHGFFKEFRQQVIKTITVAMLGSG